MGIDVGRETKCMPRPKAGRGNLTQKPFQPPPTPGLPQVWLLCQVSTSRIFQEGILLAHTWLVPASWPGEDGVSTDYLSKTVEFSSENDTISQSKNLKVYPEGGKMYAKKANQTDRSSRKGEFESKLGPSMERELDH